MGTLSYLWLRCILVLTCVQYLSRFRIYHHDHNYNASTFLLVVGENLNDSSSNSQSSSSSQPASNAGGNHSDVIVDSMSSDLNDLTDKELEHICTSRGFELVKESNKETGQPINYSHQDYVDAARQCLEIEAEMERILKENPNLLEEMEVESRKLMEEKSTLEAKLKQTQNLLDEKKKASKESMGSFPYEGIRQPMKDNTIRDQGSSSRETHNTEENESKSTFEGARPSSSSLTEAGRIVDDDDDVLDLDQMEINIGGAEKSKNLESLKDEKSVSRNDMIKDNHDDDDDDDLRDDASSSSLVEKAHSSLFHIIDMLKEYKAKVIYGLERIYIQYLPAHIRKQFTEVLKPINLILQSTGQSLLSMVKRYCIVILEGAKQKIDTTLIGLSNDSNKG